MQTPTDVPDGHYWALQVSDAFTNIVYQLGSRVKTPGGKYLTVGPDWEGKKPEGFLDVLPMPTNVAWLVLRSFMAPTPESRVRNLAVLGQINVYPLSDNEPGLKTVDPEAISKKAVYSPGVTPEMLAAYPEAFRPQWVNPATFWENLEKAFELSPKCDPDDQPMADPSRTLLSLDNSDPVYKALLDEVALEADTELRAGASYVHTGVDNVNGWQRQENSGVWGTDWFGRAQAAVIYIVVMVVFPFLAHVGHPLQINVAVAWSSILTRDDVLLESPEIEVARENIDCLRPSASDQSLRML